MTPKRRRAPRPIETVCRLCGHDVAFDPPVFCMKTGRSFPEALNEHGACESCEMLASESVDLGRSIRAFVARFDFLRRYHDCIRQPPAELQHVIAEQAKVIAVLEAQIEAQLARPKIRTLKKRHGFPLASLLGKRVRIWLERDPPRFVDGVVRVETLDCNGSPLVGRPLYMIDDPAGPNAWHPRPAYHVTETRDLELL